ncbi:aldo/keto reductase [Haladaptatus salinisoli]|uniref:aldo/keto reductase n=1 Tax=Haladaptatus salinisoli TaxID=2884876 RepID=UPI001D0B7653|nr:aldo/keto reductase [Haladaptatus salinisoli]
MDSPDAGVELPAIGLGTWKNTDSDRCAETVRTALELGYRHVDTAAMYGNESAVGDGIARADVPREDVVVATKVWHDSLGYDDVIESAENSRSRLGVDAIDVLYVHWPCFSYDPEETLPAFDHLREEGAIRHVGVSNFTPDLLDEARAVLDAPIVANQVEMHPLLPQAELREHCAERGVRLVAYSPLIHGEAFDVPELSAVAERRGASEAQVGLAWLREKGVAAIPKASGENHLADNLDSLSLDLSDEDVERIDAIEDEKRISTADWTPW